ncbi:hypothetical protein HPB49_017547 [Dermacentor silvarum]|uniref:Uncharacterized protein n=1 Tax=Dermacentor silvarum TaxID=543639 RepID=A0ACB8DQP7_DERSI|nr:hypothetical protein HPB49_017547 [Dermacentor silvarum]
MRRPSDAEAGQPPVGTPDENPFADKHVRIGFTRKVYAILSVQLLLTTAVIAAFVFVPELNKFSKVNGKALTVFAGIASTMVLSTLLCSENLKRSFPSNFILLFLFIDLTYCIGFMLVLGILLMVFGIVAILFRSRMVQTAYACTGAAIFSVYIVFDTQLITGGSNRAFRLSPEDYIMGTVLLYLDAINMFIFLLRILKWLRGDD